MDEALATPGSRLVDVAPLVDILAGPSSFVELDNPGSKGYLSHLATLSLAELTQEPITLQTQAHHLTSSLTSFTHTSYPTFISLHKNTESFASSIDSLSSSLSNLLTTGLPVLEGTASIWKNRTEAVLRERNKARVVLEQHEKIRDLLDIPVLIDTCVRNGYFGEALALASHVTSLVHRADVKKEPPPAILTSVLAEVQHSITQMHLSLLATLYEPNRKLPALWKAVNFLRKMGAFSVDSNPYSGLLLHLRPTIYSQQGIPTAASSSEPSSEEQLALAFLIGREACLKTTLEVTGRDIQRFVRQVNNNEVDDVGDVDNADDPRPRAKGKEKVKELGERDKEDLARYLKKYIDAWRESVYDIVTQFATMFLERSPAHSETPMNTDSDGLLLSRLHTLLRTYSTRTLSTHLLAIVKPSLPLLTLSHLPSLLTQLTYCSTAFSRLGLDFRCLLVSGGGLFSAAVLSIVKRDFGTAAEKWVARVDKAYGTIVKHGTRTTSASSNRTAIRPAELPSNWLVSPSVVNSPPVSTSKQTENEARPVHIPPQILASYPPVAQLTNDVLDVLNGLRLIIPRNAEPVNGFEAPIAADGIFVLLDMVDEIILNQSATALMAYFRFVMRSLAEREQDSETQRVERGEEKVIFASSKAFCETFAVFVRRALVEGVYGIELDLVERARTSQERRPEGKTSWAQTLGEFQGMMKGMIDRGRSEWIKDAGEERGENSDGTEQEDSDQ